MPLKSKKLLSIVFLTLGIVFLIGSIISFTIIGGAQSREDMTKKAVPTKDNVNLWARVPGILGSSLKHVFKFFEYKDKPFDDKVSAKEEVELTEKISYDDFNFDDKNNYITFRAYRNYTISEKNKTNDENNKISSVSLGLFETLESLTNPNDFQLGVSSIHYLLNNVLLTPKIFIIRLFAVFSFESIAKDKEIVMNKILKQLPQKKREKIAGSSGGIDEKYTFATVIGYNRWLQLTNKTKEEIEKIDWIKKNFSLNYEEIQTFLGKATFLADCIEKFNSNISLHFNIPNPLQNREILYLQLINGSVTKQKVNLKNFKELAKKTDPENFAFGGSPELSEYKTNNNISIDRKTLMKLIEEKSEISLLSSKMSSLLLILNKTNNIEKAKEIFNINGTTLNYLSDYIFKYLTDIFIHRNFNKNNTIYKVNSEGRGLAILLQKIVDMSYGKLAKHSGLYDLILSKLVFLKLNNESRSRSFYFLNSGEDACAEVMQRALDDGRKTLAICGDPKLSFTAEKNIAGWISAYDCVMSGEFDKCDMSLINYLRSIVFITDEELKLIYNDELFKTAILSSESEISNKYKCPNKCNNSVLAKLQFWKSSITKDPISPFKKAESVHEWNPEEFPIPIELEYYRKKVGSSEEIKEKTVDTLIGLYGKGEEGIRLFNRFLLEEELTLIILNKASEEISKAYKSIKFMINYFLFNNTLLTNYKDYNSILSGNNEEDHLFINFISNGEFYNNFKPKTKKTTGFGLNFSLKNNDEIDWKHEMIFVGDINNKNEINDNEFEYYTIIAKNSNDLRKIINMNSYSLFNIKKPIYDIPSNSIKTIIIPIYNYVLLNNTSNKTNEDFYISDGIQYDSKNKKLAFYDPISSRPIPFNFKESANFNGIACNKFELDKENMNMGINEKQSQYSFANQKFDKSVFIINPDNEEISKRIDGKFTNDNYICVDPLSNMVISMKMNVIYGIYTKNLGIIYDILPENKMLPIIAYSREFNIDKKNYETQFPSKGSNSSLKTTLTIVFVSLFILCIILFIVLYRQYKSEISRDDIEENVDNGKLVPSRDGSRVKSDDLRELNDEEGN